MDCTTDKELRIERRKGSWVPVGKQEAEWSPKKLLWRMCKCKFLKQSESVVAQKVQSKVEHLTSIAFLLDFLTSTRIWEPMRQQKIQSRIWYHRRKHIALFILSVEEGLMELMEAQHTDPASSPYKLYNTWLKFGISNWIKKESNFRRELIMRSWFRVIMTRNHPKAAHFHEQLLNSSVKPVEQFCENEQLWGRWRLWALQACGIIASSNTHNSAHLAMSPPLSLVKELTSLFRVIPALCK